MKKFEFSRKQYDRVRKMDHNQMKTYIQGVYAEGFLNGQKENGQDKLVPDLTGLAERLQQIRGIGEAKARFVADEVAEFMEEQLAYSEEDQ